MPVAIGIVIMIGSVQRKVKREATDLDGSEAAAAEAYRDKGNEAGGETHMHGADRLPEKI